MSIKVIHLSDCQSEEAQGFQRISIFNEQTIGVDKIALEYVILPKGAESTPHAHIGTHTVVFTLQGTARIFFGRSLENKIDVSTFGCVYIPPDEIHYVVNENEEHMIAVVARTPSLHKIEEYAHLLSLSKTENA